VSALRHLYRVRQEDLWPWLDQVRAHYRTHSPLARLTADPAPLRESRRR
jgi:hypothetical protein